MAFEPLVTRTQVLERLGRPFTDVENFRVDGLISDVSAAVRSPSGTGQQITAGTSTTLLRITRQNTLRLPQRPVTAVTTVVDDLATDVSYTWVADDDTILLGSAWYLNEWELNLARRSPLRKVRVTYSHGYAEVPDDIISVVCAIVMRSLSVKPDEGQVVQESIAGYSYTLRSDTAAGPFGIDENERRILDGYRQPAGAISLA